MCGIISISTQNCLNDIQLKTLHNLQIHRGNDAKNHLKFIIKNHTLHLLHQRLSILDPDPRSNQPFSDPSGKIHITYNGEIYNFQSIKSEIHDYPFKTTSDTEVLIAAYLKWGIDFLHKLNGIFAFVLLDQRTDTLYAAVDHLGIKPLYYADINGEIAFASELKTLKYLFPDLKINEIGLYSYLTLGYIPHDQTIYKNVKKLQPGHYAVLKNNSLHIQNYFEKELSNPSAIMSDEKDVIHTLDTLLNHSVKSQLISDVPLGVFLSGGLDSSLITALAAQHQKPLKTFSIRFKDMGYYDESDWAQKVADHIGTDHYCLDSADINIHDLFPKLLNAFDEPFYDSSAIPLFILSQFTSQHVKVVLSGTGGDDLFAGYRRHLLPQLNARAAKIPSFLKQFLLTVSNRFPKNRKAKIWEYNLLLNRYLSQANDNHFQQYIDLCSVFNAQDHAQLFLNKSPCQGGFRGLTLRAILDFDQTYYLPGDLLVKEDRMTMAHTLEARVPLLDKELYLFSKTIAPNLFNKNNQTKYLLKKVAENYLPKDIIYRTKHGFAVPLNEWFKADLKNMYNDYLTAPKCPYIQKKPCLDLIQDHQSCHVDHSAKLWTILYLERWWREVYKNENP